MKKAAMLGPLLAFPAAGLVGLVWRFPVPMFEYVSGPWALVQGPMAMIFYMIMGGFILIPLLSAALALGAVRVLPAPEPESDGSRGRDWAVLGAAGAAALLSALFLAGLELIIGPW